MGRVTLMKPFLAFCCVAYLLSACGAIRPAPAATLSPAATIPLPATFTPPSALTATMTATQTIAPAATITSTPTDILMPLPPADVYTGWVTLATGDFMVKYPPSYYNPASYSPVILIADTQNTFDAWMHTDSADNDRLLVQLIALTLDRKLDPFSDNSPLATVEQALQREVNRTEGISYYVSGSTDVPWENANGGLYDGRKVFIPNVPYQNVMLGTVRAARIFSENMIYYLIIDPSDDSYYVKINIQPASSSLLQVADQILASFSFIH